MLSPGALLAFGIRIHVSIPVFSLSLFALFCRALRLWGVGWYIELRSIRYLSTVTEAFARGGGGKKWSDSGVRVIDFLEMTRCIAHRVLHFGSIVVSCSSTDWSKDAAMVAAV